MRARHPELSSGARISSFGEMHDHRRTAAERFANAVFGIGVELKWENLVLHILPQPRSKIEIANKSAAAFVAKTAGNAGLSRDESFDFTVPLHVAQTRFWDRVMRSLECVLVVRHGLPLVSILR